MKSTKSSRRALLPHLVLTETCAADDSHAVKIVVPPTQGHSGADYYIRNKLGAAAGARMDGRPVWTHQEFNLFPVVTDSHGVPWAEAVVYLLSRLESVVHPVMTTYVSIAEDLSAYRRFLDEYGVDWLDFPAHKLNRPTYRYNAHLKLAIGAGDMAASTGKRRMGAVIAFYNWLKHEGVFVPAHDPWRESDRYIEIKDGYGISKTKKVVTTDISIATPRQSDPYSGCIDDGGKLRPLPLNEQEWLVDALAALGNTEMMLIHLFGLLTGARIQTILTFRVKHALLELDDYPLAELRVPVGPGTGIDTKNDKQLVLHIPVWFYRMLQTYAKSDRAKKRRIRSTGGDTDNQYLFLSIRGAPLYLSKAESRAVNEAYYLRHQKTGQGVRQFIAERVIPYIRDKYKVKGFSYQFHDIRATYGMNLTDSQLQLVQSGRACLNEVREFVKTRMGHQSSSTTDRYLQYRQNLAHVQQVNAGYNDHLRALVEKAQAAM